MSKSSKITLSIVLACFIIGVGWGLYYQHERRLHMASAPPLRVLCAENWISPQILDQFSQQHQVPIQFFTYSRPTEFLRQMANSDGKVDVLCTSSFLMRSLIRSRWVKKVGYLGLENAKTIAVDFVHLPYDSQADYGLPLFWNLYGVYGKAERMESDWKQTLRTKKVGLWGDELNLLQLMAETGVNIEQRLEQEQAKGLQEDVRGFIKSAAGIVSPSTNTEAAQALLTKVDWVQIPLARVASALEGDHHFVLPESGAAMEVGLIAIGEKSAQPELALQLINELVGPDHALETYRRLGAGVVQRTLENVDSISPWQRPQALRRFPLNRLRFPDVNLETLPPFERIYDEIGTSDRK